MELVPHQAVISITVHVHEQMPSGQCKPQIVHRDGKLLTITGNSLASVREEVTKFLKGVKIDEAEKNN